MKSAISWGPLTPLSPCYLPYPASAVVVFRQLHAYLVTGPQPGEVGAEAVGDVSEDPGPVMELHPEDTVRERFQNHASNQFGALGHER